MVALLDEVFRGVPPRTKKTAIMKIAKKVAAGDISAKAMAQASPRADQRAKKRDAIVSEHSRIAFVSGCVFILLADGPSLDEQMKALVEFVRNRQEAEDAWIPGPSDPVPVLEPKAKKQKRSQSQSQSQDSTGLSAPPKSSQRVSAKAASKRKRD